MQISVASRAHRCLRHLGRFHDHRDEPSYCERFRSQIPEAIIGVYENPPGANPPFIVVTEEGLYLSRKAGFRRLDFDDIRDFRGPEEKGTHGRLSIEHLDRSETIVGFEGREGPGGEGNSSYEAMRFLGNVLRDRRKRRQADFAEEQRG